MTKTAAERKRQERARHKEAGRVPVTVHVRPEHRNAVREFERKLRAIEEKQDASKESR